MPEESLRCDVLVVGAGPAGSAAAWAAAREGARVTVVERRRKIGVPVRCAEYIPALLLGEVSLGRGFLTQPVRGMRTISPGRPPSELRAPGFTIRRDRFDQALADSARSAGAEYLLGRRASPSAEGMILSAAAGGERQRVEAGIVIGADGPFSRVGRWIGSKNRHLIPAVQVQVPLAAPLDVTEVHFDSRFFGGYGWVFPKAGMANVGVGLLRRPGAPGPREALLAFLRRLSTQGRVSDDIRGWSGGWIPAEPPRRVVRGPVLLVGDAAGQTHPITGAGIAPAVLCGRMAGKWAARAALANDYRMLAEYEREWRELLGDSQQRAWERRLLLEENWTRLAEVIERCWVAFREYYD